MENIFCNTCQAKPSYTKAYFTDTIKFEAIYNVQKGSISGCRSGHNHGNPWFRLRDLDLEEGKGAYFVRSGTP